MDMHRVYDYFIGVVAVCSLLHTILPPWDVLNDFPTAQKYYKVIVFSIGYVALNGRSTVYQKLSIHNPKGVNREPTLNAQTDKDN